MPRKLLDDTRLAAMGWKPKTNFDDGLQQAYEDYLERVILILHSGLCHFRNQFSE